MEYKSLPTFIKSIENRTVTGIFAVHGNMDSYQDISHPGAFTKTIAERGPKVKFLWNHNMFGGPPTAKITALREIGRDELPEAVLATAPEATGGVEVVREYLDSPAADEVFKAVQAGAVDEMSYGYDALKFDFGDVNGVRVRNLREVKLWEVSDVIFGANPATQGSKWAMPLDMLVKYMEEHLASLKAGARHSSADVKLLNSIHKAAVELGATACKGMVEEDAADDSGKSQAGEPQTQALPLTLLRQKLAILEMGFPT